ncbi:MAG: tetratricopeptide repeat protein [Planctomycetota bacterium]|jgi:tetratricopeptide (TPR) repeat protein
MPENQADEARAEAESFFEKAQEAAESNNVDEAIELYIEGLRLGPNAVEEGHIKLRELAVLRQSQGGQKPSSEEISQHEGGATPLERMLNAEYLLAKDPGHFPYGEAVLKAAVDGGYKGAAKWIADLVFLANKRSKKPSAQIYLLLKDAYAAIGRFDRAVSACERAAKLKPDDKELAKELKTLSDKLAVAKGNSVSRDDSGEPVGGIQEEEELEEVGGADSSRLDAMGDEYLDPVVARARDAFDRARQVAQVRDFDYAIELYLKGLRWMPDALEEGHLPLCELALERQRKGGKKPSMMERVKRLRGRTALEQMLNAEYLFAKDPSHLAYGGEMLKAAVAGGYKKTAGWIANYVFQENNASAKPSFQIYVLLKNNYVALGQFDKALAACQRAARLKPGDATVADELKNLTAELTVARGRYDQEGDFRKSIKDRESQDRLHAQESVVKTKDYRLSAVEEARKALAEAPNVPQKIFGLAEALSDLQDDGAEKEAIELLEDAYKDKGDFSFAQRAGLIRIKQLKRKLRKAKRGLETRPNDAAAQARVAGLSERLNDVELEHYRLCVENYPTDLQAKYEYGIRLVYNKQYDDAIPLFQEAQRDPRHKISAMDKIGLCFFKKGWFADAIDVFKQAIESYEIRDDKVGKELRYNLARSYEEQGDRDSALEIYRKIAQLDFAFRDVRQRVDKLRSKGTGPTSQ